MPTYVADCEGDGLTPTKFYCLSYQQVGTKDVRTLTTHEEMIEWLSQPDLTLIMHNGARWDIPNLERVLNIKINARLIDTLFISWYIFPDRQLHGLEWYGVDFGVPKPKIDDWHNLSLDEYIHRCEEDVKINIKVWNKQVRHLSLLYEVDESHVIDLPIIHYLMFKARCAVLQEKSKWRVDLPLCHSTLETLYQQKEEKEAGLRIAMPRVKKYKKKKRPAKPYKKDGSLSVEGEKWQALCKEHALPFTYVGEIDVLDKEEEPNPSSHEQVKQWLFSMGWKPATFKYEREDDGSTRKIPQIRNKDKELCPSVLLLAEKEPAVNLLDGLSVVNHRISILEGFVSNADEEGYVKAEVQGLTNTLRFKHKVVVNLPGVDKPYGKEIRGALKASRQDKELCGSDLVSLEEMTKRHYIYPYDPEYVEEMSHPDFDAHLDLAVQQGVITKAQAVAHVRGEEDHGKIRKPYKVVNYSAVYGVGKDKLSREMGVPVYQAESLLDAYWKRNWAVKKLAEDQRVKHLKGQMWLFNPVSKFWYSLRYTKDIFSTLNQGTGVFVFDTWLKYILNERPQLTGQFHDEIVLEVMKGNRDKAIDLLQRAIDKVNDTLKLNVKLSIDIKFGGTYASVH